MAPSVSLRRKPRKQIRSYREPDTDSDDGTDFSTPPPTRRQPTRASRIVRDRYPYEETEVSTPSSDEGEVQTPEASVKPQQRTHTQKKGIRVHRRTTRSMQSRGLTTVFRSHKRRKTDLEPTTGAADRMKSELVIEVPVLATSRPSRIPPWQTLPYHILLNIMQQAAYPLFTATSKDTGSMRWLLNTSELCKSFHEACVSALVYDPPMFPAHRAEHLITLLQLSAIHFDGTAALYPASDPVTQAGEPGFRCPSIDYRTKIKALSIEVKNILGHKSGLNLDQVLQLVPLLRHLRLYHNFDALSDRHLWATPGSGRGQVRWSYQNAQLFESLDHAKIRLSSFEWNGRFLRDDANLQFFAAQNATSPSLRTIKSLTLRNFLLPNMENLMDQVIGCNVIEDGENGNDKASQLSTWRSLVLQAIRELPELQELNLIDCNIFDDTIIASLPPNLTKLSLHNVPFVKQEGLSHFIASSAAYLTELTLQANQSLSLGFLPMLARSAPNLRRLKVDLTYHDPTSFRDTDPLFDELLPNGPPTWPSALELIQIGPLRNLSVDDAEEFYQSLVDASKHLPYLRILELKTLLKQASWRDRASLRSKWDAKLSETFHLKHNPHVKLPSTHRTQPPEKLLHADHDPDKSIVLARKSHRLRDLSLGMSQSETASQSEAELHAPEERNGRCHTVVFEISDQRPAQEQFKEADFLDSEPEGDGEWNGRDDDIAAPAYSRRYYAW